ncbi:MAG: hypothetical protein JWO36_4958, partial [Myxococcales bacterium]|nr:hypothetical protein [Myxococcales bacterium]
SVAFALHELVMPVGGGMPEKLDGFAMVASRSAPHLFDVITAKGPLGKLGIDADGALHQVVLPLPLPFEVVGGVGERALVIAVGPKSTQLAEKAIVAPATSKAPLLAGAVDQERLAALAAVFSRQPGKPDGGPATMFGRTTFTVDVDSRGLIFAVSVDSRGHR